MESTFKPEQSAIIDEVRYNKGNQKLYVKFTSGEVYRYDGVSTSKYVWFRSADSAGEFFSRNIKPNYPASRLPHGFPKAVSA